MKNAWGKKLRLIIAGMLALAGTGFAAQVSLVYKLDQKQVAFAAGDLERALVRKGHTVVKADIGAVAGTAGDTRFVLTTLDDAAAKEAFTSGGGSLPDGLKPEGFGIRRAGNTWWVWGSDASGVMYGGLETAEIVGLDGLAGITEQIQNPHLEARGIKFNIPLGAYNPSYSDIGDAGQNAIPEIWKMEFWTQYMDELARGRYNTIVFWNRHPFPALVKVDEYPNVAVEDVHRTTLDPRAMYPKYSGDTENFHYAMAEEVEVVKKITMEEKISFWRSVMQYAHDRGIGIYFITWNIHTYGVYDKYGITNDENNSTTIDYMRKSVRTLLETYPLLKGIGTTAGEHMKGLTASQKEGWLWKTYGLGVNDALQSGNTSGEKRFIHRYWQSNMGPIVDQFSKLDKSVSLDFSFKYSKARLYSVLNPTWLDSKLKDLPDGSKFWLNLRNDDIFNFRWGSPDFVREYIKNFPPLHQIRGFHMGSDGYTWAREFTSTEPEAPRQLEIHKHWYKFTLWGRLGYNPSLSNAHFERLIAQKFPYTDAALLFNVWQRASLIIPAVNREHWHDWDFHWAVEYCASRQQKNRHGIDHFHHIDEPAKGGGNSEWEPGGTEAADEIRGHAGFVLENLPLLRGKGGKELRLTLGDIEAFALLGLYYTEKITAANYKSSNQSLAADYLKKAAGHWRRYAAVASSQYNPQLLSRMGWGDWKYFYKGTLKDIEIMGGSQVSPSLAPTAGGTILEAEEARAQDGNIQSSITGHTGSGYVDMNGNGSSITFTHNASGQEQAILEFRYILDGGSENMNITVNGTSAGTLEFWDTGGPSSWAWDRKAVTLKEGANTIVLQSQGGAPKVDHLNILKGGNATSAQAPRRAKTAFGQIKGVN